MKSEIENAWMIRKEEVRRYLQVVRELGRKHRFFDVHTHPFEITFGSFDYHPSSNRKGVYGTGNDSFKSPEITDLKEDSGSGPGASLNGGTRPEHHLINLRRIYSHTGPEVFGHHMTLSGIDKVLLLPVAPRNGMAETHTDAMMEIFGRDQRFSFGCSVPNTVDEKEIRTFIGEKVKKLDVIAVKLHPNITGTDLGSRRGKERVEGILKICGEFGLPLVVHGGRSSVLKNPETAEYGLIQNFEHISWETSKGTVIIAHAGGYGCDAMEMEQAVLPVLKKLLSRFPNLMVDISGLEIDSLMLILRNVDRTRILFGSDALYAPPWTVLAKVSHAITGVGMGLEETLIQICNLNPSRYIFLSETR